MQLICPFRENWLSLHARSLQEFHRSSLRRPRYALALNHVVEIVHPSSTDNAFHFSEFEEPYGLNRFEWSNQDFMQSYTIDAVQNLSIIASDSWTRELYVL